MEHGGALSIRELDIGPAGYYYSDAQYNES